MALNNLIYDSTESENDDLHNTNSHVFKFYLVSMNFIFVIWNMSLLNLKDHKLGFMTITLQDSKLMLMEDFPLSFSKWP